MKRHVGVADVILSAAAAVLLGWIIWQDLDPRAVVFFALGVVIAELFVILRWRLSVACNRCGFDPLLYKRSPEQAAKLVKAYMHERREGPLNALQPLPRLPVLKKKPDPVRPEVKAPPA